jgi:hypothetical protein
MRRNFVKPLIVAAVMAASLCSCTTNKDLVADAAAKYTFDEWKYEEACARPTTAPGYCLRCYEELVKFKKLTEILNTTQKVGKLPPEALQALKEAQLGLDSACR